VIKFTANGVDGLGETALASGTLFEVNPGSPNGSGSHTKFANMGIGWNQGGVMQFEKGGQDGSGNTYDLNAAVIVDVSPSEVIVRMIELDADNIIWAGVYQPGSNVPKPLRNRMAI